ncbi:MAG TPA: hypothetical protein VEM41_08320 [Actinomycetota bacterium]|nr:hypothetical protein [Actinomycetota bacterium]
MSKRWEFKPANGREAVLLALGVVVIAVAGIVSVIGLVRFAQGLLH